VTEILHLPAYRHLCTLPITPCPAPRQSRKDSWNPRPCVLRYRKFKDDLREEVAKLGLRPDELLPECPWLVFRMPVSPSWSQKKKNAAIRQQHQLKPDVDNLVKAILDGLYDRDTTQGDQHIADLRATKVWDWEGSIEIWTQPTYHEIMAAIRDPHPQPTYAGATA
jgi:Holliday junction resolvase RusA-like endonuclease